MSSRFVSEGDDLKILASCGNCKHKTLGAATCKAYPRGIPREILRGEVKHISPYPGDNGIQFESIEE